MNKILKISKRTKILWLIVAAVAAAIIFALWYLGFLLPGFYKYGDNGHSGYQAVFLSNGQVYFGELRGEKGDYALLTNIYYLQQVDVPVQQTAPAPNNKNDKRNPIQPQTSVTQQDIRLVKLGSELHGPEDLMYIAKIQILFYEDLKNDSRVVQAIKAFENK